MNPQSGTESGHHILTTGSEETAETWALVLSAMQIPHRIHRNNSTWFLQVEASQELRALYELERYFTENKNWPHRPSSPAGEFTPLLQPPTLILIGSLILFFFVTGPWEQHSSWFLHGAGNGEHILQGGEWWRLFTALTLHADIVHLLSNCLIGGWLIHFFCRLTGTGLGLCALFLAAGCGNLINVHFHDQTHQFVGFSTAVFAVIGMLAVLSAQGQKKTTGYHALIPFMAGAALLAALGTSGERTDFGGHLFGLLCGLLFGQFLGRPPLRNLRHLLLFQGICFCLFLFLLIGSWMLALHS